MLPSDLAFEPDIDAGLAGAGEVAMLEVGAGDVLDPVDEHALAQRGAR